MLTELQQRLARLVLSKSPDLGLALAGGGALISLGLVERSTTDLDLFTTSAGVDQLADVLEDVIRNEGLDVERLLTTPTFVRLVVTAGDERCQIDVAQDARLMPAEEGPLGRTVALGELAADKVLALFARAVARDFVDVYFLARRFGKDRLLDLAREKDTGFDAGVFSQMLGAINRLDRDEFVVDDTTLADLQAFFAEWRRSLSADG